MTDEFIRLHLEEKLTAEQAAMAKWYTTEAQVKLIDRCLQLHGGYGYMREYTVARAYLDARVQTIYGGTTEIMKEIIGRSLVSDDSRPLRARLTPAGAPNADSDPNSAYFARLNSDIAACHALLTHSWRGI